MLSGLRTGIRRRPRMVSQQDTDPRIPAKSDTVRCLALPCSAAPLREGKSGDENGHGETGPTEPAGTMDLEPVVPAGRAPSRGAPPTTRRV